MEMPCLMISAIKDRTHISPFPQPPQTLKRNTSQRPSNIAATMKFTTLVVSTAVLAGCCTASLTSNNERVLSKRQITHHRPICPNIPNVPNPIGCPPNPFMHTNPRPNPVTVPEPSVPTTPVFSPACETFFKQCTETATAAAAAQGQTCPTDFGSMCTKLTANLATDVGMCATCTTGLPLFIKDAGVQMPQWYNISGLAPTSLAARQAFKDLCTKSCPVDGLGPVIEVDSLVATCLCAKGTVPDFATLPKVEYANGGVANTVMLPVGAAGNTTTSAPVVAPTPVATPRVTGPSASVSVPVAVSSPSTAAAAGGSDATIPSGAATVAHGSGLGVAALVMAVFVSSL
ncbi:uncharacterized protein EV422DRAFT_123735 [Fimicolochytrium jonesii]|uniref:uncharacterized protein n=1 Tax=Fimicolochytrium jonesii TaxID=1396493 RepID=UPI0022FE10F7|nr:uncharacterized protein EV422DRAFT_123735 [Fimicolochytrium jonesii]KAI8818876.1 hypothetical protein EV422DRAFT_123735 [Fimicolochytrium jonesii]